MLRCIFDNAVWYWYFDGMNGLRRLVFIDARRWAIRTVHKGCSRMKIETRNINAICHTNHITHMNITMTAVLQWNSWLFGRKRPNCFVEQMYCYWQIHTYISGDTLIGMFSHSVCKCLGNWYIITIIYGHLLLRKWNIGPKLWRLFSHVWNIKSLLRTRDSCLVISFTSKILSFQ